MTLINLLMLSLVLVARWRNSVKALQLNTANFVRPERSERPEGRAGLKLEGLTARLAIDEQTRTDAYEVRYKSYLSGGYIDPKSSGTFSDAYDEMPNTQSMVIYKKQRPHASLRD